MDECCHSADVQPESNFVGPLSAGASLGHGVRVASHSSVAIPMNSDNATGQTNPTEPPLVPNDRLAPSENKLFKKWRREFSLITGYGIDPAERVFTINHRNCERWKKDLLNYSMSSLVRFSSLRSRVI
jgi:hypothetical protein